MPLIIKQKSFGPRGPSDDNYDVVWASVAGYLFLKKENKFITL